MDANAEVEKLLERCEREIKERPHFVVKINMEAVQLAALCKRVVALEKRLELAEKVLDDIACEKQNLHGRIDDSELAHEICDTASQYFIDRNDDEHPKGEADD